MRKFRKTIRGTLSIVLIGLTVAALFGISMILVLIAQNNIITAEKRSLTNYAKYYSDQIQDFFNTKENIMQGIADGLVMGEQYNDKERTKKTIHNYKKIRSADFVNLYYIYPDQTIYRMNDAEGARKSYDVEKEQWYQDTVTEKKIMVTAPYLQTLTGNLLVTMSCPVLDNHKVDGVLSAEINIQDLVDITQAATSFGGMYGMLVDQNENYVVHPDNDFTLKEEQTVSVEDSLQTLIKDQKIHKTKDYKNMAVYIKAIPIEGCNWTYVIVEETTVLQMTQNKMLTVMVSVLIWACMIIVAVMFLMIRYQLRPVEELKKFVQQVIPVEDGKTYKDERKQIQNLVGRLEGHVLSAVKQTRVHAGSIYHNMDEMQQHVIRMQEQIQQLDQKAPKTKAGFDQQTALSHALRADCSNAMEKMEQFEGMLRKTILYATRWEKHMEQLHVKIQEENEKVEDQMRQSRREVEKSLEEMAWLQKAGNILKTIHAMTDQTNLLALRACVEATHVEKKEFAFVADEIKNLSESTNMEMEQLEAQWNQLLSSVQTLEKCITNEWDRMEQSVQRNGVHMEKMVAGSKNNAAYYKRKNTEILTLGTQAAVDLKKVISKNEQLDANREQWKEEMQAYDATLDHTKQGMEEMLDEAKGIMGTTEQLRETMSKFHV